MSATLPTVKLLDHSSNASSPTKSDKQPFFPCLQADGRYERFSGCFDRAIDLPSTIEGMLMVPRHGSPYGATLDEAKGYHNANIFLQWRRESRDVVR